MYIGLDMGTSSVGWAVTDENYKLLRAKGKDMWGSRLFDEAVTKADRRSHRTARRRLHRKHARIGLLKEFFSEEINAVDPGFFHRLKESKYHLEDRSEENRQSNALFNDPDFTDKDYYKKYPTIFHLRKELLETWNEKKDIRLLYLAIENMFKRRGNFLNTSLSDDSNSLGDINNDWLFFREKAEEYGISFQTDYDPNQIISILGEKGLSRIRILENLANSLGIRKSNKEAYELLKLFVGLKAKMQVIYGDEIIDADHKSLSLGFRESTFEETSIEVKELIDDNNYELIEAAKEIHDIGLLANILKGERFLTIARVKAYDQHKEDLQLLKKVLKKYDHNAYHQMFRTMSEGNYSAYVGSVNYKSQKNMKKDQSVIRRNGGKGRRKEDLYKTIKKLLKDYPQNDQDVMTIINKIDNEAFLDKQLTADNGVIPNQIFVRELREILKNAEEYYPFLSQKDETNLSISEKIIEMFRFRIPYYVGPLGKEGDNVWAVFKEEGKIFPWNLKQKVDLKRSREEFIKRMVGHCTYLYDEETLPQNSLLYQKFMVLNELNTLKVYGEPISVELKQSIYNELFERGKKVKISQIENFFKRHGLVDKEESNFLSGIDVEGGFKAALTTLGKFKPIFSKEVLNDDEIAIIEKIVFWMTIYTDDKRMLRENIEETWPGRFSDAQIKRITGLKMEGWGNLSREFLQMMGASKKDGEIRPLIKALWDTNDNLMMLLSERYTYAESLSEKTEQIEKTLNEWTFDDLEGLYLSAPVKRMIWQTLKIMKELVEITGKSPDKIFIEMPRSDGEKGKRTDSRKQKLLNLYNSIKEDSRKWSEEIDSREEYAYRNRKLYLYYLQMGRCMYSGEPIDLHTLLTSNDIYDIDHIYPQHLIKDDSLENNLVLVKKEINNRKSGDYPLSSEIRNKNYTFWKILLEKKMISQEKYNRLVRTKEFTDYERADFINRQIVETGQATKLITQILQQTFPKSEIVFSKAGIVSNFRRQYDLLKVRCLNNLHHAQDAYLNIVVGNVYRTKFTNNPMNFIREADKHGNRGKYRYHLSKMFNDDVVRGSEIAWRANCEDNPGSIVIVKKMMAKNTPIVTRRSYNYAKGRRITNKDTVYGKNTIKNASAYIGVSMSDPRLANVEKYGGRTDIASMCYALVEYIVEGKTIRSLEALPVFLGDIDTLDDMVICDYLKKSIQAENKMKKVTDLRVLVRDIKYNSLVKLEGHFYYLAGRTANQIELKTAIELKVSKEKAYYLKKIEKAMLTGYYKEKDGKETIITEVKNIEFYEYICGKMKNTIMKNRRNNIATILESGKDRFVELDIQNQCRIIVGLINWINGASNIVDLRLIGGSSQSGKCRFNKKLNNLNEIILINNSITGLYECAVDLLKI